MMMSIKNFWNVVPQNLVDIDRCFRRGYYLHSDDGDIYQTTRLNTAEQASEMSVNFNVTTRHSFYCRDEFLIKCLAFVVFYIDYF
jgi:hypothetical protein